MTTYNSTTTLAEIRAAGLCEAGWAKLLRHLGKTQADSDPLPLLTILESNGFDDALWCLRVPSLDRLSRHFEAWCAERVLHLFEAARPGDNRVRDQIAMLRNDEASSEDRAAARDAAWAATRAACASSTAAWSAWHTAQVSAWSEARAAQEAHLRKMIAGEA